MTAELECLLDDVVTGKQEMMGAIDAVCDAARRIIAGLEDGAVAGEAVEPGVSPGGDNSKERPPTAAMKKFTASIARRKGIKPPAGYTKSGAICRAFLDLHAPERPARDADGKPTGETGSRPPSPSGKDRTAKADGGLAGFRPRADVVSKSNGPQKEKAWPEDGSTPFVTLKLGQLSGFRSPLRGIFLAVWLSTTVRSHLNFPPSFH